MSSSTVRIPKYTHFKPRDLARVRLEGRDIYLGKFNSPESHAEYQRVIAEWLVQKQAPAKDDSQEKTVTVAELMVSFLRHAKDYYVKDGKQTREFGQIKEALAPVRELYQDTLADQFGPLCLQAVRQRMIQIGWCRKHINKQISRVRRMFRFGVASELVRAETYQALTAVADLKKGRTTAPEHPPVLPVPAEVVEATLPELSHLVADMVRYHRLTGCRPTEVCLLRPGEIDRSEDVWAFTPNSHKTDHLEGHRTVYIGPGDQAILTRYVDRPNNQFCFDPRQAPKSRKNARERYTKDSYGRAIRRAVERINQTRKKKDGNEAVFVESWSPNQLRHSAATEIRKQFGIEGAQVILGHASADVTQVYAERDLKLAKQIARKLG